MEHMDHVSRVHAIILTCVVDDHQLASMRMSKLHSDEYPFEGNDSCVLGMLGISWDFQGDRARYGSGDRDDFGRERLLSS